VRRRGPGLAELAGTSTTAVSQHLSKLRLAGLVTNRREGTFVIYSLADPHVGALLGQALAHAGSEPGTVRATVRD
jgi:DNA-binding transcriptional ArsR family regulator